MSREKAYDFLMELSWEVGTMGMEYRGDKDAKKMREAINILYSGTDKDGKNES